VLNEDEIRSFLTGGNAGAAAVKKANFPSLEPVKAINMASANMSQLEDVQIEISVELGQASIKIKDVLGLARGSVIKLNKAAGDELDVVMNGQHFAKGEVVVIKDSFGVRIASINRAHHLKLTDGIT
jgi:flagellar motor switch protein FliN/FliY